MSKIEGLYAWVYDLVVNSRIVPSGMDIKTSEGVESFSVFVCVRACVCMFQAHHLEGATGCNSPTTNLDAPTRSSKISKTNKLISPTKDVRHPTVATCCLIFRNVCMYVCAEYCVQCCRMHYVI